MKTQSLSVYASLNKNNYTMPLFGADNAKNWELDEKVQWIPFSENPHPASNYAPPLNSGLSHQMQFPGSGMYSGHTPDMDMFSNSGDTFGIFGHQSTVQMGRDLSRDDYGHQIRSLVPTSLAQSNEGFLHLGTPSFKIEQTASPSFNHDQPSGLLVGFSNEQGPAHSTLSTSRKQEIYKDFQTSKMKKDSPGLINRLRNKFPELGVLPPQEITKMLTSNQSVRKRKITPSTSVSNFKQEMPNSPFSGLPSLINNQGDQALSLEPHNPLNWTPQGESTYFNITNSGDGNFGSQNDLNWRGNPTRPVSAQNLEYPDNAFMQLDNQFGINKSKLNRQETAGARLASSPATLKFEPFAPKAPKVVKQLKNFFYDYVTNHPECTREDIEQATIMHARNIEPVRVATPKPERFPKIAKIQFEVDLGRNKSKHDWQGSIQDRLMIKSRYPNLNLPPIPNFDDAPSSGSGSPSAESNSSLESASKKRRRTSIPSTGKKARRGSISNQLKQAKVKV
jgi:hypothetical protein